MGTTVVGEPGSVGWNELSTTDVAQSKAFYTALFGWTAQDFPMPEMQYTVFQQGERSIGGLMPMPSEAAGAPSFWAVYFVVEDTDETFDEAKALGATVVAPLMDVPTVGRLGFLADPQGAVFAVIRFEMPAA
jgi:predicted enzyme related to lactoylglutathione lyase